MGTMSDDLKLNRLTRFHKHSPRLLLEWHGSCEVPAGCGGAVMRWRDPSDGQAATVSLYCDAEGLQVTLNGARPPTRRVLLPFGPVVVALHLRGTPRTGGLLFALQSAPLHRGPDGTPFRAEPLLLSGPRAGWRYTTTLPDGDWRTEAGYDDSDWSPLVEVPPVAAHRAGRRSWGVRSLEQAGAKAMGFPSPPPHEAWIRCTTTLEAP